MGRSTYRYYVCVAGAYYKRETCSAGTHHKAQRAEARVWSVVWRISKDPGRLRAGLGYMIEQESRGAHGAPASETNRWLEEISEEGRNRARLQETAAEGLIDFEELRSRLAVLEKTPARPPSGSYTPCAAAQSTWRNWSATETGCLRATPILRSKRSARWDQQNATERIE